MLLGNISKLSDRLYSVLYSDYIAGRYDYPWLSNVKAILKEVGQNEIWINQAPINTMWIPQITELTLKDQFKQSWLSTINDSSKCLKYRIYKTDHKFEDDLITMPYKLRISFINFRTCNHKLQIEAGRWRQIDRNLRKCNHCLGNVIADEYHYVFECPFFDFDRSVLAPFIRKYHANTLLFYNLFNETTAPPTQ